MKLTWYGTATILLESNGYRIVFDPFLGMPLQKGLPRRNLLCDIFQQANAVLVTHGHFDHIHDIPELYTDKELCIYATKTPCATLKGLGVGEEKLRCISPSDHLTLGPFHITVYQGRHCRFDGAVIRQTVRKRVTLRHPLRLLSLLRMNRAFPENEETLFYEVEADGVRLQLMGSMGMDEAVDYPTGADVLVLPFQGTGDPARTVKPIISRLRPRSVLLDHYDDAFPPMSSEVPTQEFAARMTAQGIPTEPLAFGKTIVLS